MFRSIAIQASVFIGVFLLFSWFKTLGMLEPETPVGEDVEVLNTLSGDRIKLSANGKTKILYFFAPWCQICHLSIGNLQSIYEKNEQIDVVAIALDYLDKDEIEDFIRNHQLTIPIVLGNEQIKQQFKIDAYPSYYVISEDNTITWRSVGYSSELGLYLRTL